MGAIPFPTYRILDSYVSRRAANCMLVRNCLLDTITYRSDQCLAIIPGVMVYLRVVLSLLTRRIARFSRSPERLQLNRNRCSFDYIISPSLYLPKTGYSTTYFALLRL